MYGLWGLAAIAAGAGIGLFIVADRTQTSGVAPVPVAKAGVKVTAASAASTTKIAPAATAKTADLSVKPAASVYQSQTTSDLQRISTAAIYQPAAQPTALQPGFSAYGFGQGGPGTDAVVIK
jgi:hypothetical protein